MFETIIFGDRETNKPLRCYKVGLMGCKSITEIKHEPIGNLDCFSYRVEFEDGSCVEVRDTLMIKGNILPPIDEELESLVDTLVADTYKDQKVNSLINPKGYE